MEHFILFIYSFLGGGKGNYLKKFLQSKTREKNSYTVRIFKASQRLLEFRWLTDFMSPVFLVIAPHDKQANLSQPLSLPVADAYFKTF